MAITRRRAVRVLLFDEANRVLLVRFWDGDHSWWCTPGGGVEENETDESAALRELREELGEAQVALGPCIWTRRHVGEFRGMPFDQSERIHIGHVHAFEPRPSGEAILEHRLSDIRWWTVDELEAAENEFSPRLLPRLVRDLLTTGPPAHPIDVGV